MNECKFRSLPLHDQFMLIIYPYIVIYRVVLDYANVNISSSVNLYSNCSASPQTVTLKAAALAGQPVLYHNITLLCHPVHSPYDYESFWIQRQGKGKRPHIRNLTLFATAPPPPPLYCWSWAVKPHLGLWRMHWYIGKTIWQLHMPLLAVHTWKQPYCAWPCLYSTAISTVNLSDNSIQSSGVGGRFGRHLNGLSTLSSSSMKHIILHLYPFQFIPHIWNNWNYPHKTIIWSDHVW